MIEFVLGPCLFVVPTTCSKALNCPPLVWCLTFHWLLLLMHGLLALQCKYTDTRIACLQLMRTLMVSSTSLLESVLTHFTAHHTSPPADTEASKLNTSPLDFSRHTGYSGLVNQVCVDDSQ